MTLEMLHGLRKCAVEIAGLSDAEQVCRPFRIRAPEMLQVLDLAIAQKELEHGSVVLAVDPSWSTPKRTAAISAIPSESSKALSEATQK